MTLKCMYNKTSCSLLSRMASSCLWTLVWLIVLLVIGWPLSIFLGGLYGLFAPLTACLGLDRLTDLLMAGVNLGRTCAQNMRHGTPMCWGCSILTWFLLFLIRNTTSSRDYICLKAQPIYIKLWWIILYNYNNIYYNYGIIMIAPNYCYLHDIMLR